MKDDEKYWLSEFGLRRWQHKTLPYELQRSYYWKDDVLVLGNSTIGGGRKVYGFIPFSELENMKDYIFSELKFDIEDFEIIDNNYYRIKKLERIIKCDENKD
jgi:hypothetical protein